MEMLNLGVFLSFIRNDKVGPSSWLTRSTGEVLLVPCEFPWSTFLCSASPAADIRIAHRTHPDPAVSLALSKWTVNRLKFLQTRHLDVG